MDENQTELVRLLYTRIGMLMEDASIIALTLGGSRSGFSEEARGELAGSVRAIAALTAAVDSLEE